MISSSPQRALQEPPWLTTSGARGGRAIASPEARFARNLPLRES